MEIDYVLVMIALEFMQKFYLISGHVDHKRHIIIP
jgi:hypothetical protein